MRRLLLGCSLIVLLGIAVPAFGQQGTAALGGKVIDAQGGAVPGVNIIITNEDTGAVRETISTAEGGYFAAQMLPGRYRIQAKLEGFKALDRRDLVLIVGQTTAVDLTMEVGGLTETLTVTGDAPLVDVTTPTIGGHITNQELIDLPAANRNYMAFVGNVPGLIFNPDAGFLNDSFQANGQPTAANNIVFDGAGNTDEQRGSNVGGQTRVANESIAEVQILANQFDAEWGRASGAVINAVTKSGTNSLTGSAFAFFTGKNLTSRDYFAELNNLPKPDVGKDEWGFTLGGPVIRNKLHYFVSVERLVHARNWSGNFSNRPDMNYTAASEESAWNTLWRIDHQLSPKHTWAFRWQREGAPQFNVLNDAQDTLTSQDDETDLDQTLVATITSVVSDTKVNTIRYGAVLEDTVHSNPAWRALSGDYATCVPCAPGAGIEQLKVAPRLDYDQFNSQAHVTMDYSIQDVHSIDDTFSWFVPDKMGRHDFKFGARYTRSEIYNPNWGNMNGTFVFRGTNDRAFNPSDPRTYPERFNVRVSTLDEETRVVMHVGEVYAQDKWQLRPGMTLSAGLRYDLEVFPYAIPEGNPLFSDRNKYPVDKGNLAPRVGFVWNPDNRNKSVIRGGYGIFYDRTLLGEIDNLTVETKFAQSFTADFPRDSRDLGPSNGQFPTDPILAQGRVDILTPQSRAIISSTYPPGTTQRSVGTIRWDTPNRQQPKFHQVSVGYERELFTGVSISADYIHMRGRDMFLLPNANPALGTNTVRDGPRVSPPPDPYGLLAKSIQPGEANYTTSQTIRLFTTDFGYSDHDALNIALEKRYSHNYSVRASYSYSYTRGVTTGQATAPDLQIATDPDLERSLRLDEWFGRAGEDRPHKLTISGRMEIPKARGVTISGQMTYLSGTPFTVQDQTVDSDRNRVNFEPLPAGTYNPFDTTPEPVCRNVESNGRRNGARCIDFFQLDLRLGYRARLGGRRTLDIFAETFNVTDRANFNNPGNDRRVTGSFLRLSTLRGVTGFPRQVQIGARLGF